MCGATTDTLPISGARKGPIFINKTHLTLKPNETSVSSGRPAAQPTQPRNPLKAFTDISLLRNAAGCTCELFIPQLIQSHPLPPALWAFCEVFTSTTHDQPVDQAQRALISGLLNLLFLLPAALSSPGGFSTPLLKCHLLSQTTSIPEPLDRPCPAPGAAGIHRAGRKDSSRGCP